MRILTVRTLFSSILLAALVCAARTQAAPVRIALLSDTHTNRATTGDQAQYRVRLDAVIAAVNAAHVDLVLVAGDLTQGGKPEEMTDFQSQIKGLQAPVLVVPGNHDIGNKKISSQAGGVKAERVAAYERTFGPSFWEKTVSGIRLIGINSPVLGSGLEREAEQWAFLEKTLAAPSQTPTLLLSHYPLFVATPDEPGGVYWNMEPIPRARLMDLLKRGGARAVLSGHLHRGLTAGANGMLFYSTPPVSFGLPQGKQPIGWTLITVSADGGISADFKTISGPVNDLSK